jgi:predicted permease
MAALGEFVQRVLHFGRRSRFDRELEDEIQFHIETRADELEAEGVLRAEALRTARREFGSRARMSEETRAAWRFQWIEDFWRDLIYAVRTFRASPGFAFISILSLAIGVGANCVLFSMVEGTLLRLPRIPRPLEVVAVVSKAVESNAHAVSYPDYKDVRDRTTSFQGLTAYSGVSVGFAPRPGMEPSVKEGKLVSGNFFEVLGVGPEIGRSFLPEEDRIPGRDSVVIISRACWEGEFGSDPSILGKQARINGNDFTIIGILPRRFTDIDDDLDDSRPDFYIPMRASVRMGREGDAFERREVRDLTVLGRLKPDSPLARARAEVATIGATLEKEYPATNKNRGLTVQTVRQYRGASFGNVLSLMLMTLAGSVLLVACANVAGLLTSRAPARAKEMAMRLAIGAGRSRLIRQLLTESMLLAAGGGAAGVAIGYIPIAVARQIQIPGNPPSFLPFELNGDVLLFTFGIVLLSVLLFGLLPAFQATRGDLAALMKGSGAVIRHGGILRKFFRGRNFLVAGQVAIALLLLTVSSLLYVGVYRTISASFQNPGFQVDHLLAVDFETTITHYKGPAAGRFFDALVERVRGLNEVEAATLTYQSIETVRPENLAKPEDVATSGVWGDESFFDALGIPIVRGRPFRKSDTGHAPSVAIVNEVLARHHWPGQDVLGRRLRVAGEKGQLVEVVGVVKINNYHAFGVPPQDIIFLPYVPPAKPHDVSLLVRTAGDPFHQTEPLRKIIHELDPDQPVPTAETWRHVFGIFTRMLRLGTAIIGSMGVLGLLLALVGLYGLVMFEVNSRTREIGIRMALGARQSAVVRMVLREGVILAGCGVGAAVGLKYGIERLLAAFFGNNGGSGTGSGQPQAPAPNGGNTINFRVGTETFGDHGFLVLVLAVFLITLIAAYIPARRASRVDPNVALKCE